MRSLLHKNCVARYTIFLLTQKMNEAGDTPAPRSSGWHSPAPKQPNNRYAFAGAIGEGRIDGEQRATQFHKRWMPGGIHFRKNSSCSNVLDTELSISCGHEQVIILWRFCPFKLRSGDWHENGCLGSHLL